MKKIVLLTSLYFTGIVLAFSQTSSGSEGPKLLKQLKVTCQLSSQQMAKLQPIVDKHALALQTDKKKLSGTELKEADNTENISYEAQLKGILSADQMNAYKNSQK